MTEEKTQCKILYVEDVEHDKIAFMRALSKSEMNCDIHHCSRAEDAIHLWENSPQAFDVLITDYKLPGMKGLELSKYILHSSSPIPVIMLTGEGSEELAVDALKTGVQDYLIKDTNQGYLQLLPVLIPQVIKNFQEHHRRLEVEEKLRKSEARYRSLFENLSQSFFLVQLFFDARNRPIDALYLESNQVHSEWLGRQRSEIIGRRMSDFYTKEWTHNLLKEFALPAIIGENVKKEFYYEQNERYVNIFTYSPAPGMAAFIVEDIQQKKEAEEKIKKSEEKYRLLANTISDVICQVDKNGVFTFITPSVKQVIGFEDSEVIDLHFDELVHPDDLEHIKSIFLKNLYGNTTTAEWRCKTKAGTYLWLETNASPLYNENGEVKQLVASSRDISARKESDEKIRQMNDELRISNASKDKFFSILAHDLLNPFQVLSGLAKVLVERFDKFETQTVRKYIRDIADTADSTYELVENLLIWSRAQSGRLQITKDYFDLEDTVSSIYQLMKKNIEKKEISLMNTITDNVHIYADKNMIDTIIRNLIGNAVKFTPRGGNITLKSENNEKFIRFSVSDDGIGMDEETRENLFKIEKTFSEKGTEDERGTGLGLILCSEFISAHGGEISVDSKKGKGSTFTIILPKEKNDL